MGYYDSTQHKITLGDQSLQVFTKPGAAAWDEVSTSALLLAQYAEVAPDKQVLVMHGGGALAIWASRQGAQVAYYDHDLLNVQLARRMAQENKVTITIKEGAFLTEKSCYDTILLTIPKGRALARLLLNTAWHALKPEGRLFLAGRNDTGAKAVLADARKIFGHLATLGSKARHRVGVAIKAAATSHTAQPPSNTLPLQQITLAGLQISTLPGVFSADGLDEGTALLLSHMDATLCKNREVLDVGCGYGIIGLKAAQLGAVHCDLSDINLLALECAQQSRSVNTLTQCKVIASDLYADLSTTTYDLILSNPPFHAGHAVDTQAAEALITGAWERLKPDGCLWIVANRFLPYDRLIESVFGSVRIVDQNTRYWVLEGRKA